MATAATLSTAIAINHPATPVGPSFFLQGAAGCSKQHPAAPSYLQQALEASSANSAPKRKESTPVSSKINRNGTYGVNRGGVAYQALNTSLKHHSDRAGRLLIS